MTLIINSCSNSHIISLFSTIIMNIVIVIVCFEIISSNALIIITNRFFLFNFDEFEKTLRYKKLTHFSLSYLKTLKFFKFNDIK